MHLIAHGRIKAGSKAKNGQLLFTDQSIFVMESTATATTTGAAVGGLLGSLIGQYLDRRKAKLNPPEHLQDLEIAGLEDKIRDKLLTTRLLMKLPLNQNLNVKPTFLGFEFTVPGQPSVFYSGWANKKKILRFLTAQGIHVNIS